MKSNNTLLYIGLAAIGIGGIALATSGKKQAMPSGELQTGNTDVAPVNNVPATKPLNVKLLLKVGVTGAEVAKLQTLLNVGSDGVFGPMTEAALFKLKGVKQTTLESFASSPTVNQNKYPVGTRVMSNNKDGTRLYKALKKADGSYHSDYTFLNARMFGEHIGTIRSSNQAGNWYTVLTPTSSGDKIYFVRAEDIKKY